MEKLIITAALNGSGLSKENVPSLPVDPEEIVEDACECCRAGASIIHYHARDAGGKPTADLELFQRIDGMILERCDVLIQHTFDMVPEMKWREKLEVGLRSGGDLQIQPLQCPWDPEEPLTQAIIEEFAEALKEQGMKWEMVTYDLSGIERVKGLIEKDLVEEPYYITMSFGERYGIPGDPRNLLRMVDSLPEGSVYTVIGISHHQLPMTTLSILLGGHVRVGLEDSTHYTETSRVESNVQVVSRVARIARDIGREKATPDEARKILGIK